MRRGPRARGGVEPGHATGADDAADRTARPAISSASRCVEQCVSVSVGRRLSGHLGVRRGLLPQRRGRTARAAVPGIPRVSRQHGAGAAGGRRLCLHGGVGNDGAVILFSGHHAASYCGDSACRVHLSADGPSRCDHDSAEFRCHAGRHLAVHLRCDAQRQARSDLVDDCLPAGVVWLRSEGWHRAAARLVTRSASGGALAGLGADERRHAEDCRLWSAARELRSAGRIAVVVGAGGAFIRPVYRILWRHLCRGADRHEAAVGLVVD